MTKRRVYAALYVAAGTCILYLLIYGDVYAANWIVFFLGELTGVSFLLTMLLLAIFGMSLIVIGLIRLFLPDRKSADEE